QGRAVPLRAARWYGAGGALGAPTGGGPGVSAAGAGERAARRRAGSGRQWTGGGAGGRPSLSRARHPPSERKRMRIKKALGALTVAVAVTAGTFVAMGAAAPSAEAGLVCTASINGKTVTSVCKSFSRNSYKYVRAIAS